VEERADFGELLRRYRLAAGLTQEALAERTGLSVRGLSDLERGARRTPQPSTVRRLAQALDLSEAERADLQAVRDRRPVVGVKPARRQPPSSLPAPLTGFVGRERELAETRQLLERARLLTLVGPGGVGKSRLALEAARLRLGRHPDGIWLMDLAPLADPALLTRTVASVVGVIEGPRRSLEAALAWLLRERDLLLIFDNCEHLIEACAGLVDRLLRACPDLRVIATSREPLGIGGEQLYDVAPLTVPPEGEGDPERLRANDAACFFVERARLARPTFALTEEIAEAVTTICRRLDGIPLALELAAARLRTMSPAEIAVRLDDRFALLANGQRTAQPRHRTLRGMVDWSWELLGEQERALLLRLAVFAGGWTREAAERVASDGSRAANEDLPLLATRDSQFATLDALVDRSLVVSDDWRGSRRYRLLDTIRSYAEERLRASGEEALVRTRHLDWAVRLAEQAEPRLWTFGQRSWLERLDLELPNLRAALTWSLESGQTEAGSRVAASLWAFWERRGHLAEARQWLSPLLAAPAGELTVARAKVVAFTAYFAYLQGDLDAAVPLGDKALALTSAVDDPFAIVAVLLIQAVLASTGGDLDRSEAHLHEALARSREASLGFAVRISLMNLGELKRMRGDDQQAAALLEECLALSDAAGDAYPQGYTLMSLGHLRLHQGDLVAAGRWFGRALTLWNDLDDVHTVPHGLEGLAWTAAAAGRSERAACLLEIAAEMREAVGGTIYPHWQADHQRATETARTALGEAAFAAAVATGRALTPDQAIAYALEGADQA
jgi:predicted ATPase/DNA-binding XRE family transcriptional regulator